MAPYTCMMQCGAINLEQSLQRARCLRYSVLAVPLSSSELPHEFEDGQEYNNSFADMILTGRQWSTEIIGLLSEGIDCDADDPVVRKLSEQVLQHDISFGEYLLSGGYLMVRLKSGNNTNLARIIADKVKGHILVQVPVFNPKCMQVCWRSDKDVDEETEQDCWHWWNDFRWMNDFNPKLKVVLELNASEVPSSDTVRRWLGEPVEALIMPDSLFESRRDKFVIKNTWLEIVSKFLRYQVSVMIRSTADDDDMKGYAECITALREKFAQNDTSGIPYSYNDVLEIPLQPLHQNLNCYTYEIFEKDPVKYALYQDAIAAALMDRIAERDIGRLTSVIMILGAGRGPLIRAAINASVKTKRKIRIYVIEKNPNAIKTLKNIAEKMWAKQDIHIFSKDMRDFEPPERADMVVSELLGSFGDNELSPECLDCTVRLLKEDGISIPCNSTSFMNPVMSPKIYNAVRHISSAGSLGNDKYSTNSIHTESNFVVLLRNVFHIDFPQPVFKFVHPNRNASPIDNTRYKILKFEVSLDAVLTGVAGYFESVLYKDIKLSINPPTHTQGLISWFPMYFPFTNPIDVKAGDIIEVHIWRCVNNFKVWYEWCLVSPTKSHVHNLNGRWCPIYLS